MDSMSARGERPSSRRITAALFLGASLALAPTGASAQQCGDVPTGMQTYFVLGHEQQVWDMMTAVRTAEGGANVFGQGINSVVSAVAAADNQVVYYDHWEDGYEANALVPVQASRLVLGDGIDANGRACDFTNDPRVTCAGPNPDRLFRGTAIVLNSDQGLGACAAGIRCSVPVNPRGVAPTAVVRFDGGDHLVTSGGPLSIIHSQDPLYPYVGGATEMLSQQANANATSFTVPVGENLYRRYAVNGDDTPTEIFKYVYLDLVAYQDNTQVFVTSPVDGANPGVFPGGTASFTLMKGQHWSSRGSIYGGTVANTTAPAVQVNAGTRISTTGPLTGLIFTAGDTDSTTGYSTDFFPLLPDLLHATDYTLPMPGTNTAGGASPMNVYIFNPNPTTPLRVTATDSVGSVCFTVPANGFAAYSDAAVAGCGVGGVGRIPPAGSTVRLSANRAFWGVAVADSNNNNGDWGYSWLGNRFLTGNYTCSATPGVLNPAANSTPAQRLALGGYPTSPDPQCTIPPTGAVGACDSANRQPVWIAATQDNTRVRVDLNNDSLYDIVDTNSDDCPDQGQGTDLTCAPVPPAYVGTCGNLQNNPNGRSSCIYTINAGLAPRFLNVYDFTDYDNTGTQIVADKPVAVAYGQDPEQTLPLGAETFIVDTGYVIFPIIQSFLDPVLVLDKSTNRNTVASATGGPVIYTLRLQTYNTAPLTNISIDDLLPAGVPGSAYVAGSTLVTYPDLSQGTNNPVVTVDGATGRSRLTWTLAPNTLDANSTLTIRYTINVPAGAAGALTNSATASGTFGSSVFSPSACATIVRTNVTLSKTVVHDGTPEVGDGTPAAGETNNLTYGLSVRNNGGDETNVRIVDPIPPDTTFAGGITNSGPFTGVYSAAQNAVVWTAALFQADTGPFTLGFQVAINPGTAVATVVTNMGGYESVETSFFQSNPVDVTVVGASLTATKTSSAANLRPGQTFTFEIQVQNSGTAPADNLFINDPMPNNTVYVPGTFEWRLNAGAFVPLTDQADSDQGTIFADRIEFRLAQLGVTQDVTLRFQVRVTGANGQFVNNQAVVSSDEVTAFDTNLVQLPIVGSAAITGRVFLDLNGNGVLDAGEPGIANVDVVVLDSAGVAQRVTTDSNGNYTATVPPGNTSVNVDESDPDFPTNAALTTANDPQTLVAPNAATNVGYNPGSMSLVKRSNGNNEVGPGQVVTYTITLRNNTAAVQNDVLIDDTLPAGVTYVANSTQIQRRGPNPAIRVTEYVIDGGECLPGPAAQYTGATCLFNLAQNLSAQYFAIVQGSDVNGTTDMGPGVNYARVSNDPFGTGDFTGGIAANQLQLTRGATSAAGTGTNWQGVVTVVECVASCDTAGFLLKGVEVVNHAAATAASADNTSATDPLWTDINQVMLVGGFNGAGCSTAQVTALEQPVCQARFSPSGTRTINWSRSAASALTVADSTVMVVEWGNQWNVQRVRVTGTAGGDAVDAAGEYNVAALPQGASRANTWVWGTGFAAGNAGNIGTQAEAAVITLGTGVSNAVIENTVAVATETTGNAVDFDVWALTHPNLATDWRFLADGNSATSAVNQAVNAQGAEAFALSYNSQDPAGTNNYPRPNMSARYSAAGQVTLARRRNGSPFAAWIQGVDMTGIREVLVTTGGAPANLVTAAHNVDLAAGETVTVTFRVQVNDPLAAGINSITNQASHPSALAGSPFQDSVTDAVLRPGVVVEYDNAGYALAGNTVTYDHVITNTGPRADSYRVTVVAPVELGWRSELVNPSTGAILASDSNGDGIWDGGVIINTGLLAPNESIEYSLRVFVPAAAAVGTKQTTQLQARSDRHANTTDTGVDETIVLGPTDVGKVIILPDNSGVITAGGTSVYTHRVINNTGVTDTIDLRADSSLGAGCASAQPPRDPACWFATIHYDSNGDGEYTPGVDIAIANTQQLAPGQQQLIFVVVVAPAGAPTTAVDVTHLTARSRANPNDFDGATDTTSVLVAGMDLSGGGSLLVQPGALAVYPGTLLNTSASNDIFEFGVTASSLFGLDQVPLPTELWVDTNGDGTPDLMAAVDSDGDGVWNSFAPGFDSNSDGRPDRPVAAGATLAYELRRPVDMGRTIAREFVTLTAEARLATTTDSVTATELLALATRAAIRGLRVDPAGFVLFATGLQRGTAGFNVYALSHPATVAEGEPLNRELVRARRHDTFTPTVYRVPVSPDAVRSGFLLIEELETDGGRRWSGPYVVGDEKLARAYDRVAARLEEAGAQDDGRSAAAETRAVPANRLAPKVKAERDLAAAASFRLHGGPATSGRSGNAPLAAQESTVGVGEVVKVEVRTRGLVRLRVPDDTTLPPLKVTHLGRPFPSWSGYRDGHRVLEFMAAPLSSVYTDRNVYVVGPSTSAAPAPASLTYGGAPPAPLDTRAERSTVFLANAADGQDPWLWDLLYADGGSWPYAWWDPTLGGFDLPDLAPGSTGPVPVTLRLVGRTSHDHTVTAALNGQAIGSVTFTGAVSASLQGSLPAEALRTSGNELTLEYSAVSNEDGVSDAEGLAYLDHVDLSMAFTPQLVTPVLKPLLAVPPFLRGADYLIITHPDFTKAAQQLAAAKKKAGLVPIVVTTEQAYDTYGAGVTDARAIAALIRDVKRRSPALAHVLLLGDDTFDTRDFLGTGAVAYVPSLFANDGVFGRVPSENLYADVDGDARPDLAIGRLPAQTLDDAYRLVSKVVWQQHSLATAARQHFFAVDNSSAVDSPFRAEAEDAARLVHAEGTAGWADIASGIGGARAALRDGLARGYVATHYFGHGGVEAWADENLLDVDDVASLTIKPTVVFTWGCESQWFQNLWGPSLNEALLLKRDGGAVASFGPTGITPPAAQQKIYRALYPRLAQGMSLGEAIRQAKREVILAYPEARMAVEGFNLLGDPALVMPMVAPPDAGGLPGGAAIPEPIRPRTQKP